MKKIFILKGKSKTGKTTKINKTAEWIINHYGCPNTIGLDISDYLKDTHGVLIIKNLSIGINSSGDTEEEVKKIDNLNLRNGDRPDIIICSCRTKGKGKKHIDDNYNYASSWLSHFLPVQGYPESGLQTSNDVSTLDELKAWLIGLDKL